MRRAVRICGHLIAHPVDRLDPRRPQPIDPTNSPSTHAGGRILWANGSVVFVCVGDLRNTGYDGRLGGAGAPRLDPSHARRGPRRPRPTHPRRLLVSTLAYLTAQCAGNAWPFLAGGWAWCRRQCCAKPLPTVGHGGAASACAGWPAASHVGRPGAFGPGTT